MKRFGWLCQMRVLPGDGNLYEDDFVVVVMHGEGQKSTVNTLSQ
jgi:hypothetical protein